MEKKNEKASGGWHKEGEKADVSGEKEDSPVVELIIKSNRDFTVFCDVADGIDAQMDHALSNHVSNLQTRAEH